LTDLIERLGDTTGSVSREYKTIEVPRRIVGGHWLIRPNINAGKQPAHPDSLQQRHVVHYRRAAD
jgi:hypothetical protein